MDYKTNLKRVRGLGSGSSGLSHWKWQRLTAIALVPIYIWFILILFCFIQTPEAVIDKLIYSPFPLLLFVIMINVSIYHGVLGFKVVCEDYIHNEAIKNIMIICSYFASFLTVCAVTFSLLINFIVNL
jgi:succinate dehydrogenase / fumarate reductase, membrane anchor subunit